MSMSEKRHIVQPLNRSTGHGMSMRCPYLYVNDNIKICKRMVEADIDARISDFDIEHYCNGNPVSCYYFRNQNKNTKDSSLRSNTFTTP
jgi:hypothetical protein